MFQLVHKTRCYLGSFVCQVTFPKVYSSLTAERSSYTNNGCHTGCTTNHHDCLQKLHNTHPQTNGLGETTSTPPEGYRIPTTLFIPSAHTLSSIQICFRRTSSTCPGLAPITDSTTVPSLYNLKVGMADTSSSSATSGSSSTSTFAKVTLENSGLPLRPSITGAICLHGPEFHVK